MKIKIAKFLICENPLAEESRGKRYILHTRFPFLLAEVMPPNEDKTIDISAIWTEANELTVDEMSGLMRRMGDWYTALLKNESLYDAD